MMLRKEVLLFSKAGGATSGMLTAGRLSTGESGKENVSVGYSSYWSPPYGDLSVAAINGLSVAGLSSGVVVLGQPQETSITNYYPLPPPCADPFPNVVAVRATRLDTGLSVRLEKYTDSNLDAVYYATTNSPLLFTEADVGKTIEITLVLEWA